MPKPQIVRGSNQLEATVEAFITSVRARTRNRRTVEAYQTALRSKLLPFCRRMEIETLERLDSRAMDGFAVDLQDQSLSAASVASYLRHVRQFMLWANREYRTELVDVPRPRVPKADLREQVLTPEEMERIWKAAPTLRDRVLIELLATTGLRLGEALNLTEDALVDQGRRGGRYARVRHRSRGGGAKGDSHRLVPITSYQLFKDLERLAEARPSASEPGRIFVSNRRRPEEAGGGYSAMSNRTAENALRIAADRAGIHRRVWPHLLRHSFASAYLAKTNDPVSLQRILGHSDMAMIANVYGHLSDSDLFRAMRRAISPDDED